MGAPDRRGHRVEAAVSFPGGVPYQWFATESEGGNSVAETIDGGRSRGANGLAELPEVPPRIGRQGREVGTHL